MEAWKYGRLASLSVLLPMVNYGLPNSLVSPSKTIST